MKIICKTELKENGLLLLYPSKAVKEQVVHLAESVNKAYNGYMTAELKKPSLRIKPEEPKSRRMTYRQLAEWLAKCNGQYTPLLSKTFVSSSMDYDNTLDDNELSEGFVVRRWGSNEWVEPTVDVYEADCKKEA